MKTRTLILAAVVLAVVMVPACAQGTDALPDGTTYYCYGDNPQLSYEHDYRPSMEIVWTVTNGDGEVIDHEVLDENSTTITIDISGEPYGSRVTATQEVYFSGQPIDTITAVLIPLHIGSDEYTVTFMDGGRVYEVQTIDHNTLVIDGDDHVIVPAAPVKDGYTFDGWYTDDGFTQAFDPQRPVTGDMTIHAKWVGTGSGSNSSTIIVGGINVVTFDCDSGLEYEVVGQTQNSVSFTVGVVGGYEVDGAITVVSDHGMVDFSQGIYTLSGFDQNVIVTISGDTHQIVPETSSDDGSGFPWWIILIIIVAIILVAVILYYRRRSEDEAE